jgi:hypothetical protein
MGRVHEVDSLLAGLDAATAERAGWALSWLLGAEGERAPLASLTQVHVQELLWHALPRRWVGPEAELHEVAWALGDFFAGAGLTRYAALCRDPRTHEILAAWHGDENRARRLAAAAGDASGVLPPAVPGFEFGELMGPLEATAYDGASAYLEEGIGSGALDPALRGFRAAAQRRVVRYLHEPAAPLDGTPPLVAVRRERTEHWISSFRDVPAAFWERALREVESAPEVPARVHLSLAPAVALLQAVGDGLTLTEAGYLPPKLAIGLDDRFGWSEDYALSRPRGEADVRQLAFLHAHLRAQRLLTRRGRRLTVSAIGRRALAEEAALWAAVVAPGPRWRPGFEQDALAVMAVVLLCNDRLTSDQLLEEISAVLARKWRPTSGASLDDGVHVLHVEWLRLGLALGWWQDRRRLTRRLSELGRAAAAGVFRAVATGPMRR